MSPLLVIGLLAVQCELNDYIDRARCLLDKFAASGVFKAMLAQPLYHHICWHLPLIALLNDEIEEAPQPVAVNLQLLSHPHEVPRRDGVSGRILLKDGQ